ncbi:MAG: aspartate aminotransferase family protein [Deltaproteobacteria bacterium]|nr:aspartate aminotransferase family protein [Deltaproteobacteria bacterium]MBM4341342.1 aspartate aminotransferase family protein [Deltaproteobacteria bacterium]
MGSQTLMMLSEKYIAHTYNRFPILPIRGKGTRIWDIEGKEYIDFFAGLAVCNLGHCHPKVVQAIRTQAEKLIHVSNLYYIEPQIELASLLCKHSFADKVFFCNSGAEANEGALKLARKYAKGKTGEDRYEIITMERSFHGRTLATLTATGQTKYHKGYTPLMPGFKYVPFNDLKAVREAIDSKTCAILLEPIQGEGGVNIPSEGYLKGLREICDEKGILLILDEVQVGMGRTGKLFAYEHENIEPDLLTLAKSLAGGVPIGALLMKEEIAKSFEPGDHASTFGGNFLATAAGVAALNAILDEGMLENCQKVGEYFLERLQEIKKKYALVNDVRGRGLIVGLELKMDGAEIVKEMMKKGFLINCTMNTVLRFLPPLIVTKDEVDRMIKALEEVFAGIT